MFHCYSPLYCTTMTKTQKQSNVFSSVFPRLLLGRNLISVKPLFNKLGTSLFIVIWVFPKIHVLSPFMLGKAIHGCILAAKSILMTVMQNMGLCQNDHSRNSACSEHGWWAESLREPVLRFPPVAKPLHHLCIPPAISFLL